MVENAEVGGAPGKTSSFADRCAREPIHIPGSIQPHGFLLVVDGASHAVVAASANAGTHLRIEGAVIGARLTDILPQAQAVLALDAGETPDGPATFGRVDLGGATYEMLAHASGRFIIVELEEADAEAAGSLDTLYPQIRRFVSESRSHATLEELNAAAARIVRALTGFDRVLVYRFDAHWNGTVIAEDGNGKLPSYMDLRFPAADIPAQARELYRLNRLRIIPDAAYEPVPLLPADGEPIDLSYSALRSVSPVHVEYMRNMGTPASMSISLVEGNRLWGLISCHNATPRRCPPMCARPATFLDRSSPFRSGRGCAARKPPSASRAMPSRRGCCRRWR